MLFNIAVKTPYYVWLTIELVLVSIEIKFIWKVKAKFVPWLLAYYNMCHVHVYPTGRTITAEWFCDLVANFGREFEVLVSKGACWDDNNLIPFSWGKVYELRETQNCLSYLMPMECRIIACRMQISYLDSYMILALESYHDSHVSHEFTSSFIVRWAVISWKSS